MIRATSIGMLFFLLAQAFSLLLDLIWLRHRAEQDKDVEILLLRQQLRILQRKHPVQCEKSIHSIGGYRWLTSSRNPFLGSPVLPYANHIESGENMTSLIGSGCTERLHCTKNDPEKRSATLSEGSPAVSKARKTQVLGSITSI